MNEIFQFSALSLLPASTNLYVHHPVHDTTDEMNGKTETNITVDSLSMFETLNARGDLYEYVELLNGVVDTSIYLNDDGSVTMKVTRLDNMA
jgi:hypothetical protein